MNLCKRTLNALYLSDRVILYYNIVVVPVSLRSRVFNKLHYQEVTSMHNHAQHIVLWPGITQNIESIPADYQTTIHLLNHHCHKKYLILLQTLLKQYLQIFSSLLEIIFSSWRLVVRRSDIFSTPSRTTQAGSRRLIIFFRDLFSRFGVPEGISSDGEQ